MKYKVGDRIRNKSRKDSSEYTITRITNGQYHMDIDGGPKWTAMYIDHCEASTELFKNNNGYKFDIGDVIENKAIPAPRTKFRITDICVKNQSYELVSLENNTRSWLSRKDVEDVGQLVQPNLKYKVVNPHAEKLSGIDGIKKSVLPTQSNPLYCSCETPQLKKVCANHVEKIFYDYCECCKKERV